MRRHGQLDTMPVRALRLRRPFRQGHGQVAVHPDQSGPSGGPRAGGAGPGRASRSAQWACAPLLRCSVRTARGSAYWRKWLTAQRGSGPRAARIVCHLGGGGRLATGERLCGHRAGFEHRGIEGCLVRGRPRAPVETETGAVGDQVQPGVSKHGRARGCVSGLGGRLGNDGVPQARRHAVRDDAQRRVGQVRLRVGRRCARSSRLRQRARSPSSAASADGTCQSQFLPVSTTSTTSPRPTATPSGSITRTAVGTR